MNHELFKEKYYNDIDKVSTKNEEEPAYQNNKDYQSLNSEQLNAFKLMNSTEGNIFLTGNAGTGKSYVVKMFLKYTNYKVARLAPTGLAAEHIDGKTIHNFLRLQTDCTNEDLILKDMDFFILRKLRTKDIILIDEISMVSSFVLTILSKAMKKTMKNNKPFGGKKVIVVGDFSQLPPVVSERRIIEKFKAKYKGVYSFASYEWEKANFKYISLKKVQRQSDEKFIKMLNHLRYGQLVSGDIYSYDLIGMVEPISPKYLKDNVEEFMNTTFLTPSNEKAKEINNLIFNRIKAEAVSFDSNNLDYKGKVPAPKKVTVKKGQKVMITKNIYKEKELYLQNGTIGFVHKIRRGKWVKVRIPSRGDEIVKIERVSWTNKKSFPEKFKSKNGKEYSKVRKEVIGEYQQLPLKSAYAMTIHKSQGLTLDKVHVFNEKLFAPSQLYVALSRVKSINDVTLQVDIKNGQKMIKPEVYDFYKTHNLFPKELTSN